MAVPETTANPQLCLPAAASGVSITPNGTAWVNSAWAELMASSAAAWTIVGVIVNPGIGVVEFEVDIGTGAATSEVVIATTGGCVKTLAGVGEYFFRFGAPIDNIPASTRVAVRLRKAGTSTVAWTAKLVYLTTDGAIGVTANASLVVPTAAVGVTVTPNGTAWANSAWAQLSASLTDVVAIGLITNQGVAAEFEFEIGIGAATSEAAQGIAPGNADATVGVCNIVPFHWPILLSGTNRVAVRIRKAGTSTVIWTAKLLYMSTAGFAASNPQYTSAAQKIVPNAAFLTGNDAGASWANGAWLEVIASTPAAAVVIGQAIDSAADSEMEQDVGKGGAGSEAVVSTTAEHRETATDSAMVMPHVIPVDNIPASTRVAVRHRRSAGGAATFQMGLIYYEKPL